MAEAHYRQLLPLSSITQSEAGQAMLGLGQTLIASGNAAEGIPLLRTFVADFPEDPAAIPARIVLAHALADTGEFAEAIAYYNALLARAPALTPYLYEWLGDAHYAAGSYDAALDAYAQVLAAPLDVGQQVFVREKRALVFVAQMDYTAALAEYDAILAVAQLDYYRARIMEQAAQTALLAGDTADAYDRMQTLVATYPAESYAYDALVALVEAGEPVDDFQRGLVDYYAAAYGPAVEAFYRVIRSEPEHTGEPHYYAGLAYLEAGSPALALDEFETVLDTYPGDAYWGSSWYRKGQALAALGRIDAAIDAYRTLPTQLPDHPRAAEALWKAAELLEADGRLDEAAAAFLDLVARYPADSGAPEAYFRAGLDAYRAGDLAAALATWAELPARYPAVDRAQAARFWTGKAYLALSEPVSATEALEATVAAGPWGFYGLRAADLLANREPLAGGGPTFSCGAPAEQAQAEAWLASWLGLADSAGLGVLPESLWNDPRLQSGLWLLQAGRFDEARTALEALRAATSRDALTQYRLALFFRDGGLYRSSIIAASAVWQLSPSHDLTTLPRFIGCLIYPTYYSNLVEAESAEFDFDPLVLYALLRQESLFEGYATSSAAAHGLMQVIPSTGQQIASALGWPPDYETSDLYRPMVSVRFGVWYLAQQRDRFDGALYPALAGYNGGPGNAARWLDAAEGDLDLFVELIGFAETRTYVERITEHYARYCYLYRSQ